MKETEQEEKAWGSNITSALVFDSRENRAPSTISHFLSSLKPQTDSMKCFAASTIVDPEAGGGSSALLKWTFINEAILLSKDPDQHMKHLTACKAEAQPKGMCPLLSSYCPT